MPHVQCNNSEHVTIFLSDDEVSFKFIQSNIFVFFFLTSTNNTAQINRQLTSPSRTEVCQDKNYFTFKRVWKEIKCWGNYHSN